MNVASVACLERKRSTSRPNRMPDIDLFSFFRYMLAWIVGIYATIVTVQSLWGWWVWLAGKDRYMALLRRYVVVHGLRLRFQAFWGDVLICILLAVAFMLLWRAQWIMDHLQELARTAHV
ncbi:MAG TPA: hypothetical protein VHP11_07295 [Tepidisphaeraceae bacterium]|nr:hypothetical protein [Tepidisphaeraceae bacterium]